MNKTSFTLGLLQPNQISNQRLSPGIYSLSARSNIPFARLIGKGIDKIFTWGETVEVPTNQMCTVANSSFHSGDLFINGGCDLDNRPARITVPVPYSIVTVDGENFWAPSFPADVRTAKRAYLMFDASTPAAPLGAGLAYTLVGKRYDGSHLTGTQLGTGEPGTGYQEIFSLPPLTQLGPIPLGKLSPQGDDTRPHALLTIANVYLNEFIVANNLWGPDANAYYTMEY